MATTKIAVTIDETTLERLDKVRLARERAKLDSSYERSLAEEGMEREEWPEY